MFFLSKHIYSIFYPKYTICSVYLYSIFFTTRTPKMSLETWTYTRVLFQNRKWFMIDTDGDLAKLSISWCKKCYYDKTIIIAQKIYIIIAQKMLESNYVEIDSSRKSINQLMWTNRIIWLCNVAIFTVRSLSVFIFFGIVILLEKHII